VSFLLHHPGLVAQLALQQILLVATALVVAAAIALPLGILAARNRHVATPLLGFLGALYTIPSLALLALFVQYVGLGFWTAVVVLIVYAQYILVRNIATGLREVPEAQRDAATGLGMNSGQRLWRVELPLALPVMLGGVRIATVALIAVSTLAAYVNAGGLGVLILQGLQQDYPDKTMAGSIPAMLLAIAADQLFRLVERHASTSSA
jgi:osmoprotectant transport system permease protein